MIFRRSIVAELASTAGAVFTVLFSIIFSVGLVRILGQAAGGRVDNRAVFELVAMTALTYLPVLLTLTLFISVLMALSRSFRDSEMVIWFTAGQSLFAWLRPVLRFALPVIVLITLLSLLVTPWANLQIDQSKDRFAKRDDVSKVAPGRFIESASADRVFFVEAANLDGSEVKNVFVSSRSQGHEGVIVAAKGAIEVEANGDRFLMLRDGRRYEGTPGLPEYRMLEFERYAIRLESKPGEPMADNSAKVRPSSQLLAEPTRNNLAELLYRLGIPIVAIMVTLLAIPLAHANPRAGRSVNLIIAVLLFAIYLNSILTTQAWVQQGKIEFPNAMLAVHLTALALVAVMFVRRVYVQRWLPEILTPSYWHGRKQR